MISVVIAAHNEAGTIGRCLDGLLAGAEPGELDVTVVANGCRDDTAAVARRRLGVRVIDLEQPGKAAALNVGEELAVGFPRIYLDADIPVSTAVVRALVAPLQKSTDPPLATYPDRGIDLSGRPWLVRSYYSINSRLPVFRWGLFGRGMIALSETGRSRFDRFPEMVADDLFLDSLFVSREKQLVSHVTTTIAAPRRTRDLVRRLIRVRRGNAALRGAARAGSVGADVRAADRWSWLRDVVLPEPTLAPAGLAYAAITLAAAVLARSGPRDSTAWGFDESSRALPSRGESGSA
jgi:glycosyltransferase involved in cell wall biosynthesis